MTRSLTDSNISYSSEEITEAPGSAGYVNKDGDIDILVVLQVIMNFLDLLTSDTILNVLNISGNSQYFSKGKSRVLGSSLRNDDSDY